MRLNAFTGLVFLLAFTFIARGQDSATIRKLLTGKLKDLERTRHFSGVVLVAKNGRPFFHKAYGYASREYKVLNTVNTKFNLASMNKMFTGLAIIQLYQAGRLSPDDIVGKYLPDLTNKTIRDSVTIHQLLTHTSGVNNFWAEHANAAKEKIRTINDYLPLFINKPLAFPPGAGFLYSNGAYMLLGLIIEAVSGQSYDNYVRDHIFLPARMTSTGAYALDEVTEGLATGYTMNPEQPGTWKNNTWQNVIKGTPAGGGYSTAADLLKFANALQQHRFLNKGYTEIYTHGRVRYGKGLYGYGMSRDSVNGHVIIGHTGGHYGIANELMIYEDLGYTVVILTNGEVENYWEISNTLKNLLAGPSASTEGYFFTTRLVNTIREKGLQQALDEYKLKPAGIQLSESVIERSGAGELFNKQFDKAIAIFTFWITCFPHSANGYYNLAEAYRLKGNTSLAIENYKRYLEKEPEDTEVRGKMERLRL